MNKSDVIIILGTAHRLREPGKCSPDKRLKECIYSREICSELAIKLRAYGYKVLIDLEEKDLPKTMQTPSADLEKSRELGLRVNYVNEICRQNPNKEVIYVSIHNDASGKDNNWHSPNGWSVRVSPKASDNSKKLANCLYDAARSHGLYTRHPSNIQKYWSQSLKVLNDTDCPAVLTENLFQDNQKDVDYLLSEEGRHTIIRLHLEGIIDYINKI